MTDVTFICHKNTSLKVVESENITNENKIFNKPKLSMESIYLGITNLVETYHDNVDTVTQNIITHTIMEELYICDLGVSRRTNGEVARIRRKLNNLL